MSSSLVADLKLIRDKEKLVVKSVNLKTFIIDENCFPTTIKIENLSDEKSSGFDEDVWVFCVNNKTKLKNVSFLGFDKLMHEHSTIIYFHRLLEAHKINFGMSNHDSALFTLIGSGCSNYPSRDGLYEWLMRC